jgi:hypothetical protein
MSDDRERLAPRHPWLGRRSLVLWMSYRSGLDVATLDRTVTNAIALPVRHAAAAAATLDAAREAGMGVVLPGQAWLNQRPPEERGAAFARLAYAQPHPLALEQRRLSGEALSAYADAFLDAQLSAGASLVTTPAHVFDSELGLGRDQDLELARAAATIWRERQGWRPPPDRAHDPPRELHAAIAVKGSLLAAAVDELVDRYAGLDVAGYWLGVFNGNDSARQADAVARFALGLQGHTGRPVTVSGVATLHLSLLASGVAATCAGLHGMRPHYPPRSLERDEGAGIGIAVFHPAILGSIPVGANHDRLRMSVFGRFPCACGHHVASRPPVGKAEILRHNTACQQDEVRQATLMGPLIDEARLAARVVRANVLRVSLGLRALPVGWGAAAEAARTLRGDGDAAEAV